MKKFQLLRLSAIIFIFITSGHLSAQDSWSNVADGAIDSDDNSDFRAAHVFKGQLYVGSGTSTGNIYRSATGNPGSWSMVYNDFTSHAINAMASTALGGGYVYASVDGACCDTMRVMRSSDGLTWTDYFKSTASNPISLVVPFKGAGTEDSIYLVQNFVNGGMIYKSAYNSNDPLNTLGMWDTVLDLATSFPGREITAAVIHNGKFYFGTNNSASVFSSADGSTYTILAATGDPDNTTITALASFGGYLYAGTYNTVDGPQIWRTNDDITWTLAEQLPTGFLSVSSLTAAAGKLWVTVEGDDTAGMVLKSSDGTTYTVSNSNGFGHEGNNGTISSITEFGNNVYWTGQNYSVVKSRSRSRSINPYGAQIWRLCTATLPSITLGPDRNACYGSSITLDAGAGFPSYVWSTGESTQTISVSSQGMYSVSVVAPNGCDAIDALMVNVDPSPSITPPNTPPVVCNGTPVSLLPIVISNAYIPEPPIHKTTSVAILDNATINDVITVSGMSGSFTAASVMSVTIDSLYHTYAGDLLISIVAPDGSEAVLVNSIGGSAGNAYFATDFRTNAPADISVATPPFIGAFVPQDNFTSLSGGANGNWSLKVSDQAGGDEGELKGWTLRFGTEDNTLTYSWTPGATLSSTNTLNTVATPTTTTTYSLVATNIIGCSTTETVTVNVAEIGISIPAVDTVCFGQGYFMNSGSPTTHWSPAAGLDNTYGQYVIAMVTSPVTYYMTDTIAGCAVMDSVHLIQNSAITLTSPAPQTACYADTVVFVASTTGGTPPYIYQWGTTYTSSNTYAVQMFTSMSYSLSVSDAAGCVSYSSVSATILPSTDIYGTVTYSGGPLAFSNVVLYKYEPYLNHFDTAQTTTTDAAGNYHFASVNHDEYLIEAFPAASYATVVPTYYGNTFLWDAATVIMHDCAMNDTLDILSAETIALSGPGSISGTIYEDVGFGMDRVPGDPVPGIDVKLGRNPGGQMVAQTTSDPLGSPTPGQYRFTNLPFNAPGEYYTVYVDIPGLGRDSVYNVVIDASTSTYTDLNYFVDSTQIYPMLDINTGIHAADKNGTTVLNVFPNPSKGNCTVEYSITADAKVSLGVYNVLGIKVTDLVNTQQSEGTYKYNINAKNNELSSGVYFITLMVDGKASIKRLVITE